MYISYIMCMAFLIPGDLDQGLVAVAAISCLNIWSSVRQPTELVTSANCTANGDVFSMTRGSLEIYGSIAEEFVNTNLTTASTTELSLNSSTTKPGI